MNKGQLSGIGAAPTHNDNWALLTGSLGAVVRLTASRREPEKADLPDCPESNQHCPKPDRS